MYTHLVPDMKFTALFAVLLVVGSILTSADQTGKKCTRASQCTCCGSYMTCVPNPRDPFYQTCGVRGKDAGAGYGFHSTLFSIIWISDKKSTSSKGPVCIFLRPQISVKVTCWFTTRLEFLNPSWKKDPRLISISSIRRRAIWNLSARGRIVINL